MITSRDNETLKLVRKLLGQRKHREERGCSPPRARISSTPRAARGSSRCTCSSRARRSTPSSLAARLDAAAPGPRDRRLPAQRPALARVRDTCLALWRLADPGNVGTLVRTADAFDASVALSDGCADPLSPKALRASVGAIFRVPLVGWDERPARAVITSRQDNETLKLVRKLLGQRKHRDEAGLFAVEGEDLVEAARGAGIEPVHLLVAGETVEAASARARLDAAAPGPDDRRLPARRPADRHATRLPRALAPVPIPGTSGRFVRTADAFGACVALSDGCADPLSPKALRASAGAIFRVPLVRWDERSGRCVALVAHGGAPLADVDLSPPVTFLLGAEREGLPDEQRAGCSHGHDPAARARRSRSTSPRPGRSRSTSSRAAARRAGVGTADAALEDTLASHLLDLSPWVSVETHVVELPDGRVIDDWPWLESGGTTSTSSP